MSVTLHTDVGDIKVELFCEQCPKACENFLALCASDYYNGCLFHRNIKVIRYRLIIIHKLKCYNILIHEYNHIVTEWNTDSSNVSVSLKFRKLQT